MRVSTKIELVFLDFGGVLGPDAEFSLSHQKALHQRLRLIDDHYPKLSEADARKIDNLQNMKKLLEGKASLTDSLRAIIQHYQSDATAEELLQLYQAAFSLNQKTLSLLKQLLQDGVRVVIATSNSEAMRSIIQNLLREQGIDIPIYCSSSIGATKSNPDFWTPILQQENVPAARCLLIDDRQHNTELANKLGMNAIYFTSAQQLEKDLHQFNLLPQPSDISEEQSPTIILCVNEFALRKENIATLSLQEKLRLFTPFEMARHFRRNCEIDYYFELAQQLVKVDEGSVAPEEQAFFWQNLSFAYIQKGLQKEACDFLQRAEKLAESFPPSDPVLFKARQAQIRGPLERELNGDPDKGIEVLQAGLKFCKKIPVHDTRYLAEINLRRDLALCFLKKKDFKSALQNFKECLLIARNAQFNLFCLPVSNYVALSTVRLAEQRQKEGADEEAQELFSEAVKLFAEVNKNYQDYAQHYREYHAEDLLQDCQDWASHVFHYGISCCDRGLYDEAVTQLLKALEIRRGLNLQGQLQNRVAEVCEWLAKAYLGKKDFDKVREYAGEALKIYQQNLQMPDVAAIGRINETLQLLQQAVSVAAVADLGVFASLALFDGEDKTLGFSPKV